MARPVGTRDRKDLYDRILELLRDHPDGLIAYQISTRLKENDRTVRQYLEDLIQQEKVIRILSGRKRGIRFKVLES